MAPPRSRAFWRRPFDKVTASSVAAAVVWARLGECSLVPPGAGQDGWVVLVFLPEGGEPLVVATLETGAPLLRRVYHTTRLDEETRWRMGQGSRVRAAEAQVRRELARTLAKEEAREAVRR
jgi:hypothetical protein